MRPLLLAAFLVVFARGLGSGLLVFDLFGGQNAVTVRLGDSPTFSNELIRVYVTGAVSKPGVYSLHSGDRIVDAVESAGGPSSDADTEVVAFAKLIADQETIRISRIGEAFPVATTSPGPRSMTDPVDLNRADANLLRSLPGMTSALAASIVRSRESDGIFSSPDDLVSRKVLPESVYNQIKSQIVASLSK
jgi:DNA uptake protein ComE-like DNA-binding protein